MCVFLCSVQSYFILFCQNELRLRRRKNPTQVLPALCLRARQWVQPITQQTTTLWLLKMFASRRSVWWVGFSGFFHCFVAAVWDGSGTVQSNRSLPLLQAPKRGKPRKSLERSHETYRLLRRKNLIVEAVRSFKIIEGLFPSVCL